MIGRIGKDVVDRHLSGFSLAMASRAARIVRLPRSLLDPESFPHTAYVKILATLARKTVN